MIPEENANGPGIDQRMARNGSMPIMINGSDLSAQGIDAQAVAQIPGIQIRESDLSKANQEERSLKRQQLGNQILVE